MFILIVQKFYISLYSKSNHINQKVMTTLKIVKGIENIDTTSFIEVNDFMLDRAVDLGKEQGYNQEDHHDKIYVDIFNKVDKAVALYLFNSTETVHKCFLLKALCKVGDIKTVTTDINEGTNNPWATSSTTKFDLLFQADVKNLTDDDIEVISLSEKDTFTFLQTKSKDLKANIASLVGETFDSIRFDYDQIYEKRKIVGTVKKSTTIYFN